MKNLSKAISLILMAGVPVVATAAERFVIPGYVAHGVNVFNNKPIADYSAVFPMTPSLNMTPALNEVGYYQPGGDDAGRITAQTPLNTPLATSSSLSRFFGVYDATDPSLFNRTLDQIGSFTMGYSSATDRTILTPFEQASQGDAYTAKGVNSSPTVGDWAEISGRLKINCLSDNRAIVKVGVRDAIPNQVYTLWEIGVANPQTPQESAISGPFGGTPNIIVTDAKGCGYKKFEVPYCPTKPDCDKDDATCGAYVSLFHHWDDQVYGAAAANTFGGLPLGVLGANHMVWPLAGEPLQSPSTRYKRGRMKCSNY